MRVTRLRLNNYRNYEMLSVSPDGGVNVIVGENAEGKTNVLEALFLCALGRSHRTGHDGELISYGMAGGYVGLELNGLSGRRDIEFKLRSGENKKLFIDKLPASRSGELMGVMNVVMFSPEDLSLIKGGPLERRRFLDMEISRLYPGYYLYLQQYNRALKQRNALLKDDSKKDRMGMISMWDEQLCGAGAEIMKARRAFAQRVSTVARDLHKRISGDEELSIAYRPDVKADTGEDTALAILDALERGVLEDMRRGFTGAGPHRDDLSVLIDGKEARVFGSQGQQRTAALSLKLSELPVMREEKGEAPVLLLDDVFSELDDKRQAMLIEAMRDCQSFFTCTSLSGLTNMGISDMTVFRCKRGTLTRQ